MKIRHRIATGSVAAFTAGAVLLGIAPTATADSPSKTARAAEVVEKVTGSGDIASGIRQADGTTQTDIVTEAGAASVSVPATADGTVHTTTGAGSVGIGLPGMGQAKGIETKNGTIVYPDAAKNTDLAVQPTEGGGVRSLITVNNADAAKEYRFDLSLPDGAVTQQQEDGSVLVLAGTGEDADTIGGFEAPWAKDAHGNPVPTSYRIENGALVQTIAFDENTTFPVVADPWYNPFSWHWKKIWGVTSRGLSRCGVGGFKNALGLGGGTVSVNVVLKKVAGRAAMMLPGGGYAYLSAAAWGCISNL
ncbi:hypothetical protein [Streptomyces huasconensis]|uniref:hypothetical protein n=1 Tax=Streptomyces huasconensis TaxID=1854574 RepID=UPI0033F124DD